jgi:hypothetical protein
MIEAHREIFRLSLPEFIRRIRRSPEFRDPQYAAAQPHDPVESDRPVTRARAFLEWTP